MLGIRFWCAGFIDFKFLRNRVSGFTAQQLADKATKAGAIGVEGLARAGRSGKHRGNISRDLMRFMLKGCSLPLLYWALIPMRDPKTDQNNVLTWMPFLLVHEMLSCLWDVLGNELYDPSPTVEKNIKASCKANGIDFDKEVALPLGVHGDGVPNQAHKTIVAFTWNILGKHKLSERILFAALSKDWVNRTFWKPYNILVASMCMPTRRDELVCVERQLGLVMMCFHLFVLEGVFLCLWVLG